MAFIVNGVMIAAFRANSFNPIPSISCWSASSSRQLSISVQYVGAYMQFCSGHCLHTCVHVCPSQRNVRTYGPAGLVAHQRGELPSFRLRIPYLHSCLMSYARNPLVAVIATASRARSNYCAAIVDSRLQRCVHGREREWRGTSFWLEANRNRAF